MLGIDAAWTLRQPSGVALAVETGGQWTLHAAAASYGHYTLLCAGQCASSDRALGAQPDAAALLASGLARCGRAIDLVAIDMPLSLDPITARRASDNAVSRAWGARHCGTHSPSELRPGAISDELREGFEQLGYRLLTTGVATPGLIEVYPHPALVELVGASHRLPYKTSRMRAYWPGATRQERRTRLLEEWRRIVTHLDGEMAAVGRLLPLPHANSPVAALKGFEDMLDAVICAWVGICVLEGRAAAFGDERSAIWIPLTGQRKAR